MRDCDVVVLSRFPEIFEGFQSSVDSDAPTIPKVVVWDGEDRAVLRPHWSSFPGPQPFKISQSANYGWCANHNFAYHDILYAGDDTRIIEPDTISRLQALAYSDVQIGILSPSINGLCAYEKLSDEDLAITPLSFVGFVFVYIKREVIDAVSYLDERFEGYGTEDIDFCYRVRKAGFRIGMARDIHVKHGVDGHTYGSTFIRTTGEEEMGRQDRENMRRFAEKWGIENNPHKIMEFIRGA